MTEPRDDRTHTHLTPALARTVHHYRLVEKIGAGGMGEVYLAEDSKLNRKVALKFMPSHLASNEAMRARFTREAQAAARLDHPNIVTVYEVSDFEDRPFIAMQYIDGKTLRHYALEEPLEIKEIVGLVAQVAEGLAEAHASGIVHRDIKSANIILDRDRRPKILDFGLAAIVGGEMLTKAGSALGTVAFMSPEQAQGRDVDPRSDIFALGVVLYDLITGRTPFARNSDAATLSAIVNEEPEPLARFKRAVPSEIQRIVSRCLAKNPDQRYPTAVALAADLRCVSQSLVTGSSDISAIIAAEVPSIAVLPFANMSADPDNEYFSDGLTEELLNVLAKNRELKVTGRTSSFAFKGKQEDLRGIGQKLGVGTILEGSVRKAGNRVRITAQLVNAADGFHLWSETYDRVIEDIFAVQDEIAQSVAGALRVSLLGQTPNKHTDNTESYALLLRANLLTQRWSSDSTKKAIDLYRQAIDLDSNNARAWSGLAKVHLVSAAYGFAETEASYEQSRQAARRSIEIDDTLSEAYEVMGWIKATHEHDLEGAAVIFNKARSLAPHRSTAVSYASLIHGLLGHFDEALRLSKVALELDPLNPETSMNLARILFWSEKYEESRQACYRTLELNPGMTTINLNVCWNFLMQGRLDEALEAIQGERPSGYRECGLAMVYHAMGKKKESDEALANLLEAGETWAFQFASTYAFRNERDKAFEWLEKSAQLKDAGTPIARVSAFFVNLHSDPRWQEFLDRRGWSK